MSNLTKPPIIDFSVPKIESKPLRILSTAEVLQKLKTSDFIAVEEAIATFLMDIYKKNNTITINLTADMLMRGVSDSQAQQMRYGYINEWASLIVSLFSNNKYRPRKEFLESLLYYKHAFEWLFTASVWNNTDSLIERLGLLKPNRRGQLKLNDSQLLVLLSLTCLNSSYKLPWVDFIKAQPGITTTAYIALLNQSFPAISKASSEGFNYLLEIAKDFPMLEFEEPRQIEKFLGSFFHCSYATSEHKYEFKKWLTKLIRFNFDKQWLTDENKSKLKLLPNQLINDTNNKPIMLVMLEKLLSNHAMFRCFKDMLYNLSEEYQLIGLSVKEDVDEYSQNLFEKMYFIEDEFYLNDNVELILSIQPNIIFYPSIGMKLWSICLSQLRLAPKQIMMGGHPSSSYSPYIDSFIMVGNLFTSANIQPYYTERVVLKDILPKKIFSHVRSTSLTDEFIYDHNHFNSSNEIKIGINGVLTKVTDRIIDICKKITIQSGIKISFVFFVNTNANSVAYLSTYKQIAKQLSNFQLDPYKSYELYMKKISECHLLLPTLPFGGSNSNIDAMVLCKPKLFIRGKEQLYTRTDEVEWQRLDLNTELGCNNDDELIIKALKLISDDDYRRNLYEKMKKVCITENIYDDKSVDNRYLTSLIHEAIA
jgi:hypothetical protein